MATSVFLVITLRWFLIKHENMIRSGPSKQDSIASWAAGDAPVTRKHSSAPCDLAHRVVAPAREVQALIRGSAHEDS
jgi:hypothetical protein